jgi:hypothetical protein
LLVNYKETSVKQIRKRLTYANVMSSLAVFLVIGGASAFAASQLGKNSVGTKQLKSNAVTTAKIKKEAVTAKKIKKGTITGAQINLAKLGTVPSAQVANSIPAGQVHVIGAAGEPGFQSGSSNFGSEGGLTLPGASFLKDHDNVVHLEGVVRKGTGGPIPGTLFQLPPGFRPPSGTLVILTEAEENTILIAGSNVVISGTDISGLVIASGSNEAAILTGITFFAGS